MDLLSLRYLTVVTRLRSVTKAAAQLNVAQPAISRQIRLLEEELGITLLLRHPRGVQPTEAGIRFVEEAEQLLNQANRLRERARSMGPEPSGTIRFGFLPANSEFFIRDLVASFLKRYPNVDFLLHEGYSEELSTKLISRQIDLAIMSSGFAHQDLRNTLLFREPMWLVGRADIWPFVDGPIEIAQLVGLPLVHSHFAGGLLKELPAGLRAQLRSVIVGDTRTVVRGAVDEGIGFLLAPASSALADIAANRLKGAPVAGLEVKRALFERTDNFRSAAQAEFQNELIKRISDLKANFPNIVLDLP